MTEISKNTDLPGARYAIDPVAFAKALILAPLIIAAIGFWALMIPVFAVLFGGPLYLIIGTPVLMVYLHYAKGSPSGAALLGFLSVVVCALPIVLYLSVAGPFRYWDGIFFWVIFALLFGPLWGGTFGYLYNRWRSDLSRRPLPPLA